MYKLTFYVPPDDIEKVKQALFAAGAGQIGLYDHCCWQTLGEGQFRALPGSHPSIGEISQLTTIPEYKVEMMCEDFVVLAVIDALKEAHPYEEPAFDIMKCESFDTMPF